MCQSTLKQILESDPVPKSAEIRKNEKFEIPPEKYFDRNRSFFDEIEFLYEFRPKISNTWTIFLLDNFLIKIICKLVWTSPANYQT